MFKINGMLFLKLEICFNKFFHTFIRLFTFLIIGAVSIGVPFAKAIPDNSDESTESVIEKPKNDQRGRDDLEFSNYDSDRLRLSGFRFFGNLFVLKLHVASADQLHVEYKDAEGKQVKFNDMATASFGGTVHYLILVRNLMVSFGGGTEFKREFAKRIVTDGDTTPYSKHESLDFSWGEFNVGFNSMKRYYIYGGVNYSLPQNYTVKETGISGDVGYQAGLGYINQSGTVFEITARFLNFVIVEKNIKYPVAQLDGGTLGIGYSF